MRIKLFEFFKDLLQLLRIWLLIALINYAIGFLIMLTFGGRPAGKDDYYKYRSVVPYSVTINPLLPGRATWG